MPPPITPVLLVHVCTAVIALISGTLAMTFRKGSGLHRAAGTVFFGSLLIASMAGVYMAAFLRPNAGNLTGSSLTFYLVITAWMAGRRNENKVGIVDWGALLVALTIGTSAVMWGVQAASSVAGSKDRYDAPFYFVFGSIALLFALSDVRMLERGGVAGAKRIARHLWRMCLAFLFALASAYPGQTELVPEALHKSGVLYVPHILLLVLTIFWLLRVRLSKKYKTAAPVASPSLAMQEYV